MLKRALVVAVVLLSSCASAPDQELSEPTSSAPGAGATSVPGDGVTTIAENLNAPWSIAFHNQTPIISERDRARIVELDADGAAHEIAVIDDAVPAGEGGLLGIAVHEDYLFAYYTTGEDNRIDRYALEGQPGSITLGERDTILAGIPAANFHNGGRIAFGPDGMLYATAGDAGQTDTAQDLEMLSGKILRMTPEGELPPDNPFTDSLVYSYGHCNPQGIAWDDDGVMYASEFGQDTWDELNVIEAGGNYGWPEVEGIAGDSDFIDPVQQWEPAEASPSGIVIAAGSIWIANLRGARLTEVSLDDLTASTVHLEDEYGRLRDVVESPDGTLWVLTNNTDGRGDPGPEDDQILQLDLGS